MDSEQVKLFTVFGIGVVLTLIVGFYCILTSRNLLRTLIGVEVLTKAVTLLLILAGYMLNPADMGLAESLVITLIIIEVAVIVVAVGIVLCIHKANGSVDAKTIRELKG